MRAEVQAWDKDTAEREPQDQRKMTQTMVFASDAHARSQSSTGPSTSEWKLGSDPGAGPRQPPNREINQDTEASIRSRTHTDLR